MPRKIVTVDETTLLLPSAVSNALKTDLATTFDAAKNTAVTAASDAAGSAAAAASSAASITVPTDTQIASLFDNTSSQTYGAAKDAFDSEYLSSNDPDPTRLRNAVIPAYGSKRTGNVIIGTNTRTLAPSGAGNNGLPAFCVTPNGTFLAIWRRGATHGHSLDSELKMSKSTDFGDTWTTPVEILPTASFDQRDASLTTLSDGRVALTYFKSTGVTGHVAVLRFSSDNGETWSAESNIPLGFTDWHVVNGIYEMPDGELIAYGYGTNNYADTSTYTTVVLKSADGGLSWSSPIVVGDPVADGRPYNEICVGMLPNGTLMGIIRSDNGSGGGTSPGLYKVISDDGGNTWSTPVLTVSGWGRPEWITTKAGAVVLNYRAFGSPYEHMITTSWNNAVSWATATMLDAADATTYQSVYSQMVEVVPGVIGIVFGDELSGTDGMIRFKYLLDGAGVSPLGDNRQAENTVFIPATDLWATPGSAATAAFAGNVRAWQYTHTGTINQMSGYIPYLSDDWTSFDVYAVWCPTTTNGNNVRWDVAYLWYTTAANANSAGTYVNGPEYAAGGSAYAVRRTRIAASVVRQAAPGGIRVLRATDLASNHPQPVLLLGVELVRKS